MSTSKWLGFVLVMFLAGGKSVAAPVCGPNVIDPDGDGWGWENDSSCRVEVNDAPVIAICMDAGSDPDGDGWGWENDQSCRVATADVPDTSTPVNNQPGSDFDSATMVTLDTPVTGSMESVAVHYYQFEIVGNQAVSLSFAEDYYDEFYVVDRDNLQYISWFDNYTTVCLSAGQYYLILSREYNFGGEPIQYNATLQSLDINCAETTAQTEVEDDNDIFISSGGVAYFYNRFGNRLGQLDAAGNTVWEVEYVGDVNGLESLPDGSTLVFSWESVSRLDALGQLQWSVDSNNSFSDYQVGNVAVVYAEDSRRIYAIDLNDGSLRWRYDIPPSSDYNGIVDITATQDGRVLVVSGYRNLLMFDQ